MYGGIATPSETLPVGALLGPPIASAIYRHRSPVGIWAAPRNFTRESVLIVFALAPPVSFHTCWRRS